MIINNDCLIAMKDIKDDSIDMVLCDLPYAKTNFSWDSLVPMEPLWEQYKRICKKNAAIVLFATQPFTTTLISSNLKYYRYNWIWDKKRGIGFQYSRHQPMRQHEDILVFSYGKEKYNRQMKLRDKPQEGYKKGEPVKGSKGFYSQKMTHQGTTYTHKCPTTILTYSIGRAGRLHPTQKPVALCEYLIKTYTDEQEVVLDNCLGSGTTAVAAINTNRQYIGIEKDKEYFDIAVKRIDSIEKDLWE